MNIAVLRKWISCCNGVMNHVDCIIKCDINPQKMHSCSKNICSISFIPHKTNVFGDVLESACLSLRVSVCVQNITGSFCQSTGRGIKSHLVTALVLKYLWYIKKKYIRGYCMHISLVER